MFNWLVIHDLDDLKGNLLSVQFVANSFTTFLQSHKTLLTTLPYNGIVNTNRYASQLNAYSNERVTINQGDFAMNRVRIISFIVVAGMLASALALAFPSAAHAQGTNPPVPPTAEEQQARQIKRLEIAYQRELKLLEAQADRLDGADERAEDFAGRIADLKSEGKDTSALEEALADFKDVLKEARTTHDQAAAVLKTHAGFDDQGKVTEIEKARETIREAEKLLREAHRDLRPALRELMRAFREFIRDNRRK